ncbi:MAG: sigma-70 family RNA polymerase sigma factor, partial [bacterium]
QQTVQQAIRSLPENQRTVIILYRYHNLSYKEIAAVLETTVSAVESRLHRAKENLKKKLKFVVNEIY